MNSHLEKEKNKKKERWEREKEKKTCLYAQNIQQILLLINSPSPLNTLSTIYIRPFLLLVVLGTPSTRTPTLTGKQKTNKILTQTQRKYNLKYLRKS